MLATIIEIHRSSIASLPSLIEGYKAETGGSLRIIWMNYVG